MKLYYHPFSSFCQKVLIALYEADAAFEPVLIDLGDADARARLAALWPLAKFPVLQDADAGLVIPESSLIIEYLAERMPAARSLVPAELAAGLQARLWDRFYDNEVSVPMQRIVGDSLRPAGCSDPYGVQEAKAKLGRAYDILEREMAGREWAAGEAFSMADCAAAPALFYADIVAPIAGRPSLEAYYARLLARPSFDRAVEEARPYRGLFPLEWPAN